MKNLVLLLIAFLLSAFSFPQETRLDSKFNPGSDNVTQKVKLDHALLMLDDDITMDKLYTSIRYELIYSGSDKDKVYFRHNEYLSDDNGFFTIPGYSRDLQFNIGKSNVFNYKGLKIEVISANPQELQYKVLIENDDQAMISSRLVGR